MIENWAYKWMDNAKTRVLFCNSAISSNIIYSIDDLRLAVSDQTKPFRMVPLNLMKAVLRLKDIGPLSERFKRSM